MIGKSEKLFFEYVLIGSLTVRGAGVSVGGIRVVCACFIGVQAVGEEILIDFSALNVVDGGGRIDFLIITIFFFVTF